MGACTAGNFFDGGALLRGAKDDSFCFKMRACVVPEAS